jgi:NAD(P)-dependent dehydrogenase (short-subunit alcohol dehydrogenase family)
MSSKPLSRKVALVTGGSRGIGRAIAVALAAEGACVVVNYVADIAAAQQVAADIHALGGRASVVKADVVVFLATPAARWISGQCLPVNGGFA